MTKPNPTPRARQLRTRIVALGQDLAEFPRYLAGAELAAAIRAGKTALRAAELELTALLVADGAR